MSQFADINGHKIHFVTFGNGDDVVFLHGWGSDVSAFLFVAKLLAMTHRVTLVDFPGFGKSEATTKPYSVPQFSDDVRKLLEFIGIKSAVFVGHSFGGRICLELAAHFTHIVEKLVLVDSAGLKPRRGLGYLLKVGVHKLCVRLFGRGLSGSADYKKLSPCMKETFKNVVNYDETPLLSHVFCPTAIFWGDGDKETPPYMARKMKRKIADAEVFWLHGGHFSYADDFGNFMPILQAFLRNTKKSAKRSTEEI